MNKEQFDRMHDRWLQLGNPADEEDPAICSLCNEFMEYEQDVDVDEHGRPYLSGGSWHCNNKTCGEENE